MHTRTPRFLAAAALLALFAGGCTDTPTVAPAADTMAPARPAAPTRRALVPTTVKYRDNGGKPATGRSGNAVLYTLALLDREGTTTLSVNTRHATDPWRPGYIKRAQLKASSPDGKHKFTRNLGGFDGVTEEPGDGDGGLGGVLSVLPPELRFKGLGRGDRIQVQANVAGIDGRRTDVVTVTETVKRLPDLRVEMAAPAEVETGTTVNISAVVSEANGDMGVYAVCDLYVAGQLADQSQGVWIDAGDAVTCAMSWSFTSPGSFPVEVRVSTGSREWDTTNNTAQATIHVNGESPRFYTSASFTQSTLVDSMLLEQSWREGNSGLAGDFVDEVVNARTHQYGYMYAFVPMRIPGSLDVHASMSTGGRVVTSFNYTHSRVSCVSEYDGRASLDLCTYSLDGQGVTYINYSYQAGTVTYHSRNYSRMWDQRTGEDISVYHWNDQYERDDGLTTLGNDWSFEVRVSGPGGEHVAAHTLRLERQPPQVYVEPYTCTNLDEPYWNYTSTVCRASSSRAEYIYGF